MKARFIPGEHVALDGFYKHPDGTVSTMPSEEFDNSISDQLHKCRQWLK